MAQTRYVPDKDKPSVAVEIPLQNPLPDYDLEELEQPTPRDVDGILVSQGFRDLVDDARGILMDLVAHPPPLSGLNHSTFDLTGNPHFEIAQLTGAICPGDQVYRPGLWIVLRDPKGAPNQSLGEVKLEHARAIIEALVRKLGL
ncbi:MAG TPA: hypothetical protein VMJ35_03715 [Dongiaceae bacterium]|nr:hypothetical protein [Dongiaceae bacterium]